MSLFQQNNLGSCPSPYLQQHADNPVHWQIWQPSTLEHAAKTNKPILLSIGYSACHWCHVMERESFSDPATAAIMNEHFINIKVDREERPDLDKIYQQSHQLLNQRGGGWPLTAFLDPVTRLPFFIGTYFPKTAAKDQASFQQILMTIHDIFHAKPEDVSTVQQQVAKNLNKLNQVSEASYDSADLLHQFVTSYLENQDKQWGGLSGAPKFPQSLILNTLLNIIINQRPEQSEAIYHAIMLASQSMSRVGLFDHLAGGFFRYCIDDYWGVPHFEKMLYDNALLLRFYTELAEFNKEGVLAEVCQSTYQWLMAEMHQPGGGFYSTLNAETENKEGEFYLFDKTEVKALLDDQEWPIAEAAFGLTQAPNFNNQWHLHCWYTRESLAAKLNMPVKQVQWALDPIKQKLLAHRNQRPRPSTDKKVLAGWNALTTTALFKTGQLLNNDAIIDTANETLDFIYKEFWHSDGLYSCYKDGEVYQKAFFDDYAYLAEAIFESLQYDWSLLRYTWLVELMDHLLANFYHERSAFKFSAANDAPVDMLSLSDDSLPSGNGIIAQVMNYLARFIGSARYQSVVENVLARAAQRIELSPLGYPSLLQAMMDKDSGVLIVIRGAQSEGWQWKQKLKQRPGNHRVFFIPDTLALPDELAEKYPKSDASCYAIMCFANHCTPAINSWEQLEQTLQQSRQ